MRNVLIMALMLVGCAAAPSKLPDPSVSNSIAKTQVYVDRAATSVTAAKPFTGGAGVNHLNSASQDLTSAGKELAAAQADLKSEQAKCNALVTESSKQADQLKAYHSRWLGDRTIFWARWLIAAYVGLGIAGALLQIYGDGLLGGIGTQVLHLLPVSNLFAGLGALLSKRAAPTAAPAPIK